MALLAASAMVVGCQGEDDQSATPRPALQREAPKQEGKAPTRSKFTSDANALCVDARRRVAGIADAIRVKVRREDAADVAADLRRALPIADELLDKLSALRPPAGDEAIVGRYLDVIAEQRLRIRSLVEALEAEDISTIEVVVAELRDGNRRAKRLAFDYGLTKCAPDGLPATG